MWKKIKKVDMLSSKAIKYGNKKDDSRWNYLETLHGAINDEDGYNIALSGSYGTGKSSIVKTYIKKYRLKKHCITISIGSFFKTIPNNQSTKDRKDDNNLEIKKPRIVLENNEENNSIILSDEDKSSIKIDEDGALSIEEEELMEKIEKSIVKQIIYRMNYHKSKLSGIPRIQKWWRTKYCFFSISLLYIISWIFLLKSSNSFFSILLKKSKDIKKILLLPSNYYDFFGECLFILFVIILLLLLITLIYNVLIMINKSKSKIKIHNYELEIDKSRDFSNYSFLDNLYEILYYFMNSKTEVVFFEDIDRYPKDVCIKVIEDLKELNLIINNCYGMNKIRVKWNFRKKLKREKIVFVYSFKESIFYDLQQKNKFYDYIVSVMPVSTRYNSDLHFIEALRKDKKNEYKDINKELINRIAYYITDMRTIKSIVNDYNLFSNIHKKDTLNPVTKSQLFALCAYKNYDIDGYDKLIEMDNQLDNTINQFKKDVNNSVVLKIKLLEEEIRKIRSNIVTIKNELLNNNNNKNTEENIENIFINGEIVKIDEFLKDDFDIERLRNQNVYIYESNIIKNINSYVDRIQKENTQKLRDFDELESTRALYSLDDNFFVVNEKIYEYSRNNLYDDLINKSDNNKELFIKELVYLGFIRSNYINFISSPVDNKYFTIKDSRFLFCYKQRTTYFTGSVDNPDHIIEYLGEIACNNVYILNNDILNYIYEKSSDNSIDLYKKKIVSMLCNITIDKLNYLHQLSINNYDLYTKIINDLSYNFDEIWFIYNNKINRNNKIYNSIIIDIALINNLNIDDINELNSLKSIISKYTTKNNISVIPNKMFSKERVNNIFNNITKLKIEFEDISQLLSNNKNDKDLINRIVNNNFYKVNRKNIRTILFEADMDVDYPNNYRQIKYSKYGEIIINHIQNNLDDFSNEFYLGNQNKEFKIYDDNMIDFIIENSNNNEFIEEIIKREMFMLDGKMFDYNHLKLAYNYNHVLMSWSVVSKYANGDKSHDTDLLKITLDSIQEWFKKDQKNIEKVNKLFIKQLIDKLYNKNAYEVIDFIFSNMDLKDFNKYKIKKDMKKEELRHKVKYDLIDYSKNNVDLIFDKCGIDCRDNYVINIIKAGAFEKIKKYLTKRDLIIIKEYINPNQIIYVMNYLIKNCEILNNEIIKYLKLLFVINQEYFIKYKKEYINNIFDNVSSRKIKYSKISNSIKFIIKK